MKALLLVAHGSRRDASNDEVRHLADILRQKNKDHYQLIQVAFLELAEPSIPEAVRRCAEAGARQLVVLPYFLNSGKHVTEDIPQALQIAQQTLPELDVAILPHIGATSGMVNLLLQSALMDTSQADGEG